MKNISLVLNGVLFILVGVLFYLHFKKENPSDQNTVNSPTSVTPSLPENMPVPIIKGLNSTNGKIVFIDYDSLVQNYDLFKKMEKDLEARLRKSESELVSRQKKLEEDYQSYMQSQAMMTDQHRATKEQQLQQQNQELIQLRDERARQFSNQEQELNEQLLKTLYGYFTKLAKENNFAYIFTYKRGIPGIVYGTDSLNITKQVITGLNEEYRKAHH